MADCDEIFAILGAVFPNRVRACLADGYLEGLSGRLPIEFLQRMGEQIQEHCPEHAAFTETSSGPNEIVTVQLLIALPPHPDIVVRYIHFRHASDSPCNVLALASGPPDSIGQLEASGTQPMPLTSREMQLALDLAAGRKLQEIAHDQNFSIHTLRNQVKSAMRSTGTRSQAQLVSVVRDWLL